MNLLVQGAALSALLALIAGLVLACTSNQTQVRSTGNALRNTELTEHSLRVPAEADSVQFLLDVDVRSGDITWTLIDADGDVREEGTANGGERLERELRFQPLIGNWQLQLDFQDMTGDYDFRLRARW